MGFRWTVGKKALSLVERNAVGHNANNMMGRNLATLLICLCLSAADGMAQQRRVPFNGLLLDLDGNPVRSARVYVKGPKHYALTNRRGQFGLTDVNPDDTLMILVKKRLYRVPVDGRKSISIRLYDERRIESEEDEELINWGYGYVSRRECTSPCDIISGEDLRRSGFRDIMSALQGRVAGLNITVNQARQGYDVNIRGERSLLGSSTPLFMVDGVRVDALDFINIYDVDYVEVMKDGSIYGSCGANGVIMVFTKR